MPTAGGVFRDEEYYYNRNKRDAEDLYNRNREDEVEDWRRNNSLRRVTEESRDIPDGSMPDIYDVPEYSGSGVGSEMGGGGGSSSGSQIYNAPRWDDQKITALTQKRAMPGIRTLREQVNRVTGRRYDNPNVGRMTLREALQGYGSGVSSIISGAGNAAVGEYAHEYDALADASKTGFMAGERRREIASRESEQRNQSVFQANLERNKARFQSLYDKWKMGGTNKTTSYSG